MTPLSLDAPRSEVLAHAGRLIAEAWTSFDHARDGQPPIDDATRALLAADLPERPTPAARVLEDAARVLDESLAQPRPRWFGFVGSSGLEIGVIGDLLAACYDINLAIGTEAASHVERQALRWVGELVGFPGTGGACTSGGMLSNLTALAAARERALPGSRHRGIFGTPAAIYCSSEAHYSVVRAAEVLGLGSDWVRSIPIDEHRRMRRELLAAGDRRRSARRRHADRLRCQRRHHPDGRGRPRSTSSPTSARRAASGCMSTAPTACPPRRHPRRGALFAGLERADSVSVDAHKWLYLPKACGVVLVRDASALRRGVRARRVVHAARRERAPRGRHHARVLAAVPRAQALARASARTVPRRSARRSSRTSQQARLLRGADRAGTTTSSSSADRASRSSRSGTCRVTGVTSTRTTSSSRALLEQDGRVYVSPAIVDGQAVLRPCIVNFRTTDDDVRALVDVTRELGARLLAAVLNRLAPGDERAQAVGEPLGRHAEHEALVTPDVRRERREQRIGEVLDVGVLAQLARELGLSQPGPQRLPHPLVARASRARRPAGARRRRGRRGDP